MAASFSDVAKSDYILLTTFTKDGRPKPTPVWAVPDGDRLLVITQEESWKVKRIRNTPRVTIAPCDMRGNVKGEAAEAVASVLGKSANATTYAGIGKRYGLFGKVFGVFSKLRGGMKKNVTLEIRPA
ncbi:PPOX class F420-dependent oxidoreductase [Mycolicibacterium phlei]|jgi:PPOX class probable F420-dependent enzyme